jgi:hypothetical protein
MKTYRQIAQICSIGILLAANALGADNPPSFSEDFEDQESRIIFHSGDPEHYELNKATIVTEPVHSGKQSGVIDVKTDADYSLPYLYLSGKRFRVLPQAGEKLEGWLKVDPSTSEDVKVKLGISVIYPHKTGQYSAQVPLAIVEEGVDGWQKFQSEDLLEFFTNLAETKGWHAEGMFVEGWLLHLSGADFKSKHVVVYLDDLVIK